MLIEYAGKSGIRKSRFRSNKGWKFNKDQTIAIHSEWRRSRIIETKEENSIGIWTKKGIE